MHLRSVLVLLALLLAGCAPDEAQTELCRSLVPAFIDTGTAMSEHAVSTDPGSAHGVRLAYRLADGSEHRFVCRFDGGRFGAGRLVLREVWVDDQPLTAVQMALLWRAYGLTPPADLIARAPPEPAPSPARRFAYFIQQLVNGLTLGAVLALIAAGYSLVYAITGTIQFAFGEIFMIGAYLLIVLLAVSAATGIGAGAGALVPAVLAAIGATALHGWGIERMIYRPLRHAAPLAPLIAAVGLSLALREYVRLVQGARDRWVPALLPQQLVIFDGGGFSVIVSYTQLLILALSLALGAALVWLIRCTPYGRAQRACADDPAMAALVGVDVDGTIGGTFALAGALAAVAGLAVALYYGEADFNMGYFAGFKALTAALLGGFGSLGGALLGGLLLGLFEVFWSGYIEFAFKDAAIFGILILVLVFRPQGLLGLAGTRRHGV